MFWCNITATKITQTSKRMHMSGTVTCTRMAVSRFESNFILSYPVEVRDPSPLWHTPFWACSCWQSLLVPEVHSRIASCPRESSGCGCGVVFRDRICSNQLTPFWSFHWYCSPLHMASHPHDKSGTELASLLSLTLVHHDASATCQALQ